MKVTYACPHCQAREHLRGSCPYACAYGFISEDLGPSTPALNIDGTRLTPQRFAELRCPRRLRHTQIGEPA